MLFINMFDILHPYPSHRWVFGFTLNSSLVSYFPLTCLAFEMPLLLEFLMILPWCGQRTTALTLWSYRSGEWYMVNASLKHFSLQAWDIASIQSILWAWDIQILRHSDANYKINRLWDPWNLTKILARPVFLKDHSPPLLIAVSV